MAVKRTQRSMPNTPMAALVVVSGLVMTLGLAVMTTNQTTRRNVYASEPTPTPKFLTVCHVPPGNIKNSQLLTVSTNAWKEGHTPHNAHSMDFIVTDQNPNCPPLAITPTKVPTPTTKSTPTVTLAPTLSPR